MVNTSFWYCVKCKKEVDEKSSGRTNTWDGIPDDLYLATTRPAWTGKDPTDTEIDRQLNKSFGLDPDDTDIAFTTKISLGIDSSFMLYNTISRNACERVISLSMNLTAKIESMAGSSVTIKREFFCIQDTITVPKGLTDLAGIRKHYGLKGRTKEGTLNDYFDKYIRKQLEDSNGHNPV